MALKWLKRLFDDDGDAGEEMRVPAPPPGRNWNCRANSYGSRTRPMFIDEQQVEAYLYKAVLRPDYQGESVTLADTDQRHQARRERDRGRVYPVAR